MYKVAVLATLRGHWDCDSKDYRESWDKSIIMQFPTGVYFREGFQPSPVSGLVKLITSNDVLGHWVDVWRSGTW